MPRRDDSTALRQMLEFAELVINHCAGKSSEDLSDDEVLQAAVMRWIELIGEAANRVSRDTQRKHPSIPWSDIIGTRNRILHGYDEVNLQILWDTINDDIPALVSTLRKIVERLP
jgi:uncharacterized protein with HEPN domain